MEDFASLALIEQIGEEEIAIWAISVTSTSTELSGAWVIKSNDLNRFRSITDGKLHMEISSQDKTRKLLGLDPHLKVSIEDFIAEARNDAIEGAAIFHKHLVDNEKAYKDYMAVAPNDRKLLPKVVRQKLIEPEFNNWPERFKLEDSKNYLDKIGKKGLLKSADPKLEKILITARCMQAFIEMWKRDEVERKNKVYLDAETASETILPKSWLQKLP
jgi:hypothetical protein